MKKWKEKLFSTVFILGVVGLYAVAYKQNREMNGPEPTKQPAYTASCPDVGTEVTLRPLGNSTKVFVAVNDIAFKLLSKATSANDKEGAMTLLLSKQIFLVPSGTKARVLNCELARVQIRVLEGEYYPKDGWVLIEEISH